MSHVSVSCEALDRLGTLEVLTARACTCRQGPGKRAASAGQASEGAHRRGPEQVCGRARLLDRPLPRDEVRAMPCCVTRQSMKLAHGQISKLTEKGETFSLCKKCTQLKSHVTQLPAQTPTMNAWPALQVSPLLAGEQAARADMHWPCAGQEPARAAGQFEECTRCRRASSWQVTA